MMTIHFKSSDNKLILAELDSVNIKRTYGALISGEKNDAFVKEDIWYGIVTSSDFADTKPVKFVATNYAPDEPYPEYYMILKFRSDIKIMDELAYGSHLTVCLFIDFDYNKSIIAQIQDSFLDVNWLECAEDYHI
jgi:hypothetical protein